MTFQGRESYVEEMNDRINGGAMRCKKRNKKVLEEDEAEVKNTCKGVMVELSEYKREFGSPGQNGHRVVNTTDPVSKKACKAVFVPKRKQGYWDCEMSETKRIKKETTKDNDADALRPGQLPRA